MNHDNHNTTGEATDETAARPTLPTGSRALTPHNGNYLEYAKRDLFIKQMGFETYRDYLRSRLWQSIRERVMRGNPMCSACRSEEATTAHHREYSRDALMGRDISKIVPICRTCHELIERWTFGKKTCVADADLRFRSIQNNEFAHDRAAMLKKTRKQRTPPKTVPCRGCGSPIKFGFDLCNSCER